MDHCPVGIKFLGSVAAVIGKLPDQKFIAPSQFILRTIFQGQRLGAEMLQQIFQQTIRQALLIGLGAVSENTP